jgi:hypothetical protein
MRVMTAVERLTSTVALHCRMADLRDMIREPVLVVNLMHERTAANDPFYSKITREFYRDARRRHPKFPLLRRSCHGIATCVLPDSFDEYFRAIEAAARRNFKKASRNGFSFSPINHNQYLHDIARIRRSAEFRQGKLPASIFDAPVSDVNNPLSRTMYHGYPYFGILRDGELCAYAGCLVAGELCMIEHILGDAALQSQGIVPMLIISIAEYIMQHHPTARYYAYGSYFGAREEMRRFKRKFGFLPHRVRWQLASAGAGVHSDSQPLTTAI